MERLAQALSDRGDRVLLPTLPGHGGTKQDLRTVTFSDWIQAVEQYASSLQTTYGSFNVVGFSMGGLLAAYVANRFKVNRLALLGAALIYISPTRFARYTVDSVKKRDWSHFRRSKETPLHATLQFMKLASRLRNEYRRVTVPTLIVHGEQDPIVHPLSANLIYKQVRGPSELEVLPGFRHMLCKEEGADQVVERVVRFFHGRA